MPIEPRRRIRYLTSAQIIILGFFSIILLGALLLMLPLSSKCGRITPFSKTLFTATSAVCVTGLVVVDTGSYWSAFGQTVILLLIQIGGLGVITVASLFTMLSHQRISLMQRSIMQDAISAPQVGGVVRLTRFILRGTILIELLGAFFLLPVFLRDYGIRGVWMALFHSVSAFCNAGFDLLGTSAAPFVSISSYVGNPVVNLTIMLLIILGGLGFLTWNDIYTWRFRLHRYRLQSKIILTATAFLILLPAVFFFFEDLSALPLRSRILASLLQSVTMRTAGFNTVELSKMSGPSQAIQIVLMLIGGSPGSTAGGIKTTTFVVLLANFVATIFQKEDAQMFGRRMEESAVKTAATIFFMYAALFFTGAVILSVYERLPLSACLYETASAVGTVGVTLGITPKLHLLSQLVLIVLMFLGRVGALTLIFAAISTRTHSFAKLPQEKIAVG
ncbi:potassium uptake protein, TrkH family [Oribacterium sp. oral taxon 078 str. F0262]|uniref:TrkH family potassium uptake protein n=1 Tax=Oribacterium sp. oral taxon 078 TaxID=652706 RepID=UPI0001BCC08A|nr:potassium transporter TrkG [Oribacterium sp. oral taxon 078]EFE91301.1 potassium uptake protein, TrkH family [Oribacterium sp. oral taxon 078 str. F0262]